MTFTPPGRIVNLDEAEEASWAVTMCNLYSMTKTQDAIRQLAKAMRDTTGNLPPLPGIFPDHAAPIVRTGLDGVRELVMARWGLPSPKFALEGKKTDPGITNIRNTASAHWRRWLAPEHRCLVPVTSFCEPDQASGSKEMTWFALAEDRPLAFFAGVVVRDWTSCRKVKEGEVTCDLFAFLTTDPNAEVAAIHPKAMPVILTTENEREIWMSAPWELAKELQRPLPTSALRIVARGARQD